MWWIHRLDALFRGSSVKSVSSRLAISFSFSLFFNPFSLREFLFKPTNWLWALLPSACRRSDCLCHWVYVCSWHCLSFRQFASGWIDFSPELCETLGRGPWQNANNALFLSLFFTACSAGPGRAAHLLAAGPSERTAGRAKCDCMWARAPLIGF